MPGKQRMLLLPLPPRPTLGGRPLDSAWYVKVGGLNRGTFWMCGDEFGVKAISSMCYHNLKHANLGNG